MKKKALPLLILTVFLTGCISEESFSAWAPEKAFLNLPTDVLGPIFWIVLTCTIVPIGLAGLSGIILIARKKHIQGSILLGFAVGMLMITVAGPFVYLPFIEGAGKATWPAGLNATFVFGNIDGATATAWATMIPFIHAMWELMLVLQLLTFTVVASLTRSLKPLLSLVASTMTWVIFYPVLYVQMYAAQQFFNQNVIVGFVSDAAKAFDVIFILITIGDMLWLYLIIPSAVFILLLFLPVGQMDEEDSTKIFPIPVFLGGGGGGSNNNSGDSVIYGQPPQHPQLPQPRSSGDYGGDPDLPVVDGTVKAPDNKIDEQPLPNRRQGRDDKGSIITPPWDGDKKNGDGQSLPSQRDTGKAIGLAATAAGHPEIGLVAEAASEAESPWQQGQKMANDAFQNLPKKRKTENGGE